MTRHLLSINDLSLDEIHSISRTTQWGDGRTMQRDLTVALVFLTPSLRTRVGFEVAAIGAGLSPITIEESRFAPGMSAPESMSDTVRTVSDMVDLVVVRAPLSLTHEWAEENSMVPIVNAGDGGHSAEHPTQALIDLAAIESEAGPIEEQTIAISGDLGQRSVRSILKLLGRLIPKRLVLIAPESRREHGVRLSDPLASVTEWRESGDFEGIDVLYLPGLPEVCGDDQLTPEYRARYAFTDTTRPALAAGAVVISPMPVIDEIDAACREDPRVRLWGPSRRSPAIRQAVLEMMLDHTGG